MLCLVNAKDAIRLFRGYRVLDLNQKMPFLDGKQRYPFRPPICRQQGLHAQAVHIILEKPVPAV